jgi:hypothetical protein
VRAALVRQRVVEHFAAAFPGERTDVFFNHPLLARPARPVPAGNV